jgi:hypothetical protein
MTTDVPEALSDADATKLRNWRHSIMLQEKDPDLDFIRCLRMISDRMDPGAVEAMNLTEHRKQTDITDEDNFCCCYWFDGLTTILGARDKPTTKRFLKIAEKSLRTLRLPNTMMIMEWVHPTKLTAALIMTLAKSHWGRPLLAGKVFKENFKICPGSDYDVIKELTDSPSYSGPHEFPDAIGKSPEELKARVFWKLAHTEGGRRIIDDVLLKDAGCVFDWLNLVIDRTDSDEPKCPELDDSVLPDYEFSPRPFQWGGPYSEGPETHLDKSGELKLPETPILINHDIPEHVRGWEGFVSSAFFLLTLPLLVALEWGVETVENVKLYPDDMVCFSSDLKGWEPETESEPELNPEPPLGSPGDSNTNTVTELLHSFQIGDDELEISRQMLNGEISVASASSRLMEMFSDRLPLLSSLGGIIVDIEVVNPDQ